MIFFLKDITATLPSYQDMLDHEPSIATTVYARNGKVVTQLFQENRTCGKLDAISPWMVKAIPVSYTHLDVYKRQPYTSAGALSRVLCFS